MRTHGYLFEQGWMGWRHAWGTHMLMGFSFGGITYIPNKLSGHQSANNPCTGVMQGK